MVNTKLYTNSQLLNRKIDVQTREPLLKGKAKYSLPPCNSKFRSAPFLLKIVLVFFTKQRTLMRRSTVLSLPLQLVFFVHI
jgi:hypothetical protein